MVIVLKVAVALRRKQCLVYLISCFLVVLTVLSSTSGCFLEFKQRFIFNTALFFLSTILLLLSSDTPSLSCIFSPNPHHMSESMRDGFHICLSSSSPIPSPLLFSAAFTCAPPVPSDNWAHIRYSDSTIQPYESMQHREVLVNRCIQSHFALSNSCIMDGVGLLHHCLWILIRVACLMNNKTGGQHDVWVLQRDNW